MSTKAALRTAIKEEARVKASTNLDAMIDKMVADVLRDQTDHIRYGELLRLDAVITLVSAQAAYSLPIDFRHLAAVRYGIGPSALAFRDLKEMRAGYPRQYNNARPRYWSLVTGNKITLYPSKDLLAADSLLIDYYFDPLSVYTAEGSEFPVSSIETTVKQLVIARLERFASSFDGVKAAKDDAGISFTASQS